MSKVILLISGKRRSGKSTLANYFRGYGYHVIGFADPLYKLHNEIWVEHKQIYQWHGDLTRDQRERLIDLGATLRCLHPDALVRMAASAIRGEASPALVVIPNYRFPNELKIGEYAGPEYVVRTLRLKRIGHALTDGLDDHASETALDNAEFDYTVSVADGDFVALSQEATRIAKQIREEVM